MLWLRGEGPLQEKLPKSQTSAMRGLAAGGQGKGFWCEAVGTCPRESVTLGEATVDAVIDTGSQVTLLKESVWRAHLAGDGELGSVSASWFRLTAANGMDIPIKGYFVTDVQVRDKVLTDKVVIVMSDAHWSLDAPCLLGMNIIQCLPWLASALPTSPAPKNANRRWGARLCSSSLVVPANSVHHIYITCGDTTISRDVLVEPAAQSPRPGLFLLPCYTLATNGRARVPIVNSTNEDLILTSKARIGSVCDAVQHHQVDCEVNTVANGGSSRNCSVQSAQRDSISSLAPKTQSGEQSHRGSDQGCTTRPDFTLLSLNENLPVEDRAKLKTLVREYSDIFA